MPAVEWTGERYLPYVDPKICGVDIHYEHLHRYAFASEFVRGKSVLDLASGEGYGSYMLSRTASRVVGIDLDGNTVDHARGKYKGDNIEFRQGSILDIPVGGKALFDVIVCFEAIEHVTDHDRLLSEVKRLLKKDGLFIVSTPNKIVYNSEAYEANPFHVRELELEEFKKLLDGKFSYTMIFGQKVISGSSIWPLANKDRPDEYYEYMIEKDEAGFRFQNDGCKASKYYVAISSDRSLEYLERTRSTLVDASSAMVKNMRDQLDLMKDHLTMMKEERDRTFESLVAMNQQLLAITESREWRFVMKAHELIRWVLGRARS